MDRKVSMVLLRSIQLAQNYVKTVREAVYWNGARHTTFTVFNLCYKVLHNNRQRITYSQVKPGMVREAQFDQKNDKKNQTLFTSEATFFGLCPRTDRASLTHSSVLPCVHQRFTGASQQIQKHLWSLDVLSVSYGSSVTLPAQLPTDPSQIRSTQLSLLSPSDSCILFSFKLAF